MDKKSGVRCEIKDEDKGLVDVVFSTLNVIDSDRDVTRNGAFESGAKTRISAYGHTSWMGALPVGKGSIRETKSEAIMSGNFFMDIEHAAETFRVVKAMEEMQEWSYGYDPVEFSFGEHEGQRVRFLDGVKVFEVSPVLIGAGEGTRTLSAKGRDLFKEFKTHGEAVSHALLDYVTRVEEIATTRVAEGKSPVSGDSVAIVDAIIETMARLNGLKAMPSAPENPSVDVTHQLQVELIRSDLIRKGIL